MKRVLICGDSFAAEWPDMFTGWVNLLAQENAVTNIAQAGISEYKILKQVESANLKNFDYVIVSHTSYSRIHTPLHPLHTQGFHENCDLIFNDIDRFSFFNKSLSIAKGWFKYHYDDEYQKDIYRLFREKINSLISIPYISISHIHGLDEFICEKNHIDFATVWPKHRGNINHYTQEGNYLVFNRIKEIIK